MEQIAPAGDANGGQRLGIPARPGLAERSPSWSGILSGIEERLDKLAIEAGQAGFLMPSPNKREPSIANSQTLAASAPSGLQGSEKERLEACTRSNLIRHSSSWPGTLSSTAEMVGKPSVEAGQACLMRPPPGKGESSTSIDQTPVVSKPSESILDRIDHIDTVDNDNERPDSNLVKCSSPSSGRLSSMEEKLDKLSIKAGQAGFMRPPPEKRQSSANTDQALALSGPSGLQTMPEVEPATAPKKEQFGFPWDSKEITPSRSSSVVLGIPNFEYQAGIESPVIPKKEQSDFPWFSKRKTPSPAGSEHVGLPGLEHQAGVGPPVTPKKEQSGFLWLSKKTPSPAAPNNVGIPDSEHRAGTELPTTPKQERAGSKKTPASPRSSGSLEDPRLEHPIEMEQLGFPWLTPRKNRGLNRSRSLDIPVREMEPPVTPRKDRASLRKPFTLRHPNAQEDEDRSEDNEGDKECVDRKGEANANEERSDKGKGKENLRMRSCDSRFNAPLPERFPRDIGRRYQKKSESIADRFRSRMEKINGQRGFRFVPGTTIPENEAWIRANEAVPITTPEPSRPLELSPFAKMLEEEVRREKLEEKRLKALSGANARSNARRGNIGQNASDRATSLLFGPAEPVTPPDPAYVDEVYNCMQLHNLTPAMRRELEKERAKGNGPEMECSLMDEEQIYNARIGGIKNWSQFPPVQVASEFIPESKQHWNWSALDSHGRDPFVSLAGVHRHLDDLEGTVSVEEAATF